MRILSIGNSFSQDATRYLHDIAKADGVELQAANLYIGGCPLEQHYRNMQSGKKDYELQFDGHMTGFYVSMDEALLSRRWDVVTLQQQSSRSCRYETFQPYLQELAEYVRKCQPQAKILMHQTWAYEDGSSMLHNVAGYETAEAMLADIRSAYAQAAESIRADGLIPAGELMGKLAQAGMTVHRDTFHASLGAGRYALGLLWFRMLTGRSVAQNPFRNFAEPIEQATVARIKAFVDEFPPIF
jgi:hypothetical protein